MSKAEDIVFDVAGSGEEVVGDGRGDTSVAMLITAASYPGTACRLRVPAGGGRSLVFGR